MHISSYAKMDKLAGKPCCYMLKDSDDINKMFLSMGQKCLDHYYKAFNKEEICEFIENVVLNDIDPMKNQKG
ncbi:MAG: hypothetical protein IJ953_08165 [Campylobacter sp.]|nr:hypothetical protein [Campylobacter sp.]